MSSKRQGILHRLASGPVIGDGGFVFALEKRGYVKAGPFTPECVVEETAAVKQLHREFMRSGADIMQAYTYYATDDKLQHVQETTTGKQVGKYGETLNETACRIAREVADECDGLVAGSLSVTQAYKQGKGKAAVQEQLRTQLQTFVKCDVDFIICESFGEIQEMEWAIEVAKESVKPVAATLSTGVDADQSGVPTGHCAIRMAKAGADIVGVNCHFGPYRSLEAVKLMKEELDKAGLKPYLMIQPIAYHTPDLTNKMGYFILPEYPFAMDSRVCTRFEIAQWARDCYEAGIHYIGGCCGFEPHHIRAISEELCKERGKKAKVTEKNGFLAHGLGESSLSKLYTHKQSSDYWKSLQSTTGRPYSTAFSTAASS